MRDETKRARQLKNKFDEVAAEIAAQDAELRDLESAFPKSWAAAAETIDEAAPAPAPSAPRPTPHLRPHAVRC
jgi:hypothetical protein